MTYFENYDIREWLEECLSRHPRPAGKPRASQRSQQSAAKKLLLPIVSAGCLFAAYPALSINAGGLHSASLSVQSESERPANADPFYWLGSVRVRSAVSDLDGCAAAVCRQLQAGRITDVPTRTFELAAAIHERQPANKPSAGDGWITELAKAVAKLTD